MATTDLSSYNPNDIPDASGMRIGIVVSEWNREITGNLLQGSIDTLKKHGVSEEDIVVEWVPGSFELPVGAKWLVERANVESVIAIGSVIQGETRHFDFVCDAVTRGISEVNIHSGKPVIFCVLTDNTMQQAKDRSGGKHGNKGIESAVAAIKMCALRRKYHP